MKFGIISYKNRLSRLSVLGPDEIETSLAKKDLNSKPQDKGQ